MQVNIGLTTFNLEKLDDGDIAGLVKEKFDAPDIKTLVDKIHERFPGYSEPAARPRETPPPLYRGDANEYTSRVQCGQVDYPGSPALWRNF